MKDDRVWRHLQLNVDAKVLYQRLVDGWAAKLDVSARDRFIGTAHTRGGALEELRQQLERYVEGIFARPVDATP